MKFIQYTYSFNESHTYLFEYCIKRNYFKIQLARYGSCEEDGHLDAQITLCAFIACTHTMWAVFTTLGDTKCGLYTSAIRPDLPTLGKFLSTKVVNYRGRCLQCATRCHVVLCHVTWCFAPCHMASRCVMWCFAQCHMASHHRVMWRFARCLVVSRRHVMWRSGRCYLASRRLQLWSAPNT